MSLIYLYNIWEIFIIFLELVLFYIFIYSKLTLRTRLLSTYIKQGIYLVLQIFATYLCNHNMISSIYTILLSFLLNVIFLKVFFIESCFFILFWSVIYALICIIAEYITMTIPQFFSHLTLDKILLGGNMRIPFTFIYISLIAVFVFLFINVFNKKIYLSNLQKIIYIILAFFGISISHYILVVTIQFSQNSYLTKYINSLIIINMCFITMFLAMLVYIYQLGISKEQSIKYLNIKKQYELEEQQYNILLNTTNSLREIKHDTKHHLDVIKTMAQQNKLKELQNYISDYNNSLEKTNYLISTGNTAVDCIVSLKLALAKQNDINIKYSIMLPEPFPIDNISLSSLLGNILDNAVEGCTRSKLNDENFKPWIYFYIKPFQNMVIIHSENNFYGNINITNDKKIISSKNNKNHGLGLKRISDIVSQSNGIFKYLLENNIFTIHIIIPLKENF